MLPLLQYSTQSDRGVMPRTRTAGQCQTQCKVSTQPTEGWAATFANTQAVKAGYTDANQLRVMKTAASHHVQRNNIIAGTPLTMGGEVPHACAGNQCTKPCSRVNATSAI